MKKSDWILCSEKLPDTNIPVCRNRFMSKPVLVYTKIKQLFVATCQKEIYNGTVYIKWYVSGTGGRQMTVKSKVVYWAEIEEPEL